MSNEASNALHSKNPIQSQTQVSVGDSEVIGSGTVITTTKIGLTIHVLDLSYEIVFEDDAKEQSVQTEQVADKSLRYRLNDFSNPLGTSLRFIEAGMVADSKLWLSLFVQAPGKEVKIVSYTVYSGGNLAR